MYCHYSASSQLKVVSSQLLILKLAQNPFISQVIDVGKVTAVNEGDVFKEVKLKEGDVFKLVKLNEGEVFNTEPVKDGELFNAVNVFAIKLASLSEYLYHNHLVI
jgi:outer membrane protein assembly factor BamA